MNLPDISVILPVFNGISYLNKSVMAILKQDFSNFEFLILDDCSTDGSYEYLQSISDPRIQLFRNDVNKGLFYNLNFLAKKASSPLIKLWSQDDMMRRDCLREIVAFHQKYPEISFSYTDRQYINEKDDPIAGSDLKDYTPEYIPRQLHDKIALFTGSIAGNIANVTIVKDKLVEAGMFNENMKIGGDFDMWVKLTRCYDIGRIRIPLVLVRNHTGQFSRSASHFISHLKDDKIVYAELMRRVDQPLKKFGRKCLLYRKNILYFSFFLKSIRQKDWKTAKEFYRELNESDNVIALGFRWVFVKGKNKLRKQKIRDNRFLFKNNSDLL